MFIVRWNRCGKGSPVAFERYFCGDVPRDEVLGILDGENELYGAAWGQECPIVGPSIVPQGRISPILPDTPDPRLGGVNLRFDSLCMLDVLLFLEVGVAHWLRWLAAPE